MRAAAFSGKATCNSALDCAFVDAVLDFTQTGNASDKRGIPLLNFVRVCDGTRVFAEIRSTAVTDDSADSLCLCCNRSAVLAVCGKAVFSGNASDIDILHLGVTGNGDVSGINAVAIFFAFTDNAANVGIDVVNLCDNFTGIRTAVSRTGQVSDEPSKVSPSENGG